MLRKILQETLKQRKQNVYCEQYAVLRLMPRLHTAINRADFVSW